MEIKDIYSRLGEGEANNLLKDGATYYLADCIKKDVESVKYHCLRIINRHDNWYKNACADLLYSAFMQLMRDILQLSIMQDMPIEEQVMDIINEYNNGSGSSKIKPYRILHKPTGLYYKPCSETGNLSKEGKVYISKNNALNQNSNKSYILIRLIGKNKNRITEITGNKIFESFTELQIEVPKTEFEIQYLE